MSFRYRWFKVPLAPEVREITHIRSIPKNMHPVHNVERRQARVKALHERYRNFEDVVYVDAAGHPGCDAMALAIVNRQGNFIFSGSVRTSEPEVGEEAAIALAMTASAKIEYVVSDSKSAILNYARGRIYKETSTILRAGLHAIQRSGKIYLIWEPAHSGPAGNECAHDAPREFSNRAGDDHSAHTLR